MFNDAAMWSLAKPARASAFSVFSVSAGSTGWVGGCNSSTCGSATAVRLESNSALFPDRASEAGLLAAFTLGFFVLALGIGQ
jgi:hypothetical protein